MPTAPTPSPPLPSLRGPSHPGGMLGTSPGRKGLSRDARQVKSITTEGRVPAHGGELWAAEGGVGEPGQSSECSGTPQLGSDLGTLLDAVEGAAKVSTGWSCGQDLSSSLSTSTS